MTTTPSHAAPWTFRQVLADLFTRPAPRTRPVPLLTGREASARHLFGEAVQWSKLDMLEYDNSPILQGGWLAEADRRIAAAKHPERYIAALSGFTPEEWEALPELSRRDCREHVAWKMVQP